ncbi:hypothetical protein CDEST_14637 [Colletotrichum destructivum]|uniref:SWI-SNF chromatin-remodeling complex protein n=1 Tax=Colletotrichum destructivum TaxID=34406 RepID=A0AAX4J236_9PEZI|nr:hypothetical protein CDEST_14637 [Colletotrichum destructivum]
MDGSSYNYGFRAPQHTNSPLSPETPTSAYKTNVKRTKTKKWVEAKTQNYDGDDWGNDFDDDDEPDEPVPVPPLRPIGSRSASQSTTATLPSNQSSAPQPLESTPVPLMRSPQLPTTESGLSSSPRPTVGLPPLRIQNSTRPMPPVVQQPVSADVKSPAVVLGPSSTDAASEKGPYEQLVSPRSTSGALPLGVPPPPAPFASRPEHSQGTPSPPVGSRRTSPAPTQPQASPFPPRKSSMGQQDGDRRRSGSRSSSMQRPWAEQRSASPPSVISSGTPPNQKSPPFIRPSDIYRRMDDDKEPEGSSPEPGRPAAEGANAARSARSVSPANPAVPVVGPGDQQGRRGSFDNEGEDQGSAAADSMRQPILTPVAERRSEYGFDGLMAQSHHQNQGLDLQSPLASVHESSLAVPEPQLQRPTAEESDQNRRYSTSPRLPDLARMSLFGDDFFTNPSKLANEAPPMPPMPGTKLEQQPEVASTAENSQSVSKAAAPVTSPLSTTNSFPRLANSSTPPAAASIDRQKSPSPSQMLPASSLAESSKSRLPSQSSRPSIPGGWVTETPSISDQRTPSAALEQQDPMLVLDPGEVSPITDNEDDKFGDSGVVTVKDRVSIPVSIPEASERAAQVQGRNDQDTDLKISAPPNPRESGSSSSDFDAPERLQRESTMSTIADPSPVKESDKLREEIMRSLSPVRPTSDLNDFGTNNNINNINNNNNSGSSNQGLSPAIDDSGARESTYLHGVYDDYWAAGDDRPDKPGMPSKQSVPESGLVTNKDISDVPPLSPRKDASDKPPSLGRRFSWEAGSEQVTPKPLDSQKDPLSEPDPQSAPTNQGDSPSGRVHDESQAMQPELARQDERTQQSTVLDDEHTGVPHDLGVMSHQVSQVSSAPRDRMDSEAIEPPSPVSVMAADKNTMSAAPARRLSLAEEKSMARVSSNPVSPSPPPGDHPALAQAQPLEDMSPPGSPAVSQQLPAQPVKVTTFREIMDLASPSERIIKYNETRTQFASMDSGLNNWLVTLKSQHPEHANATASFGVGGPSLGQSQASPTTSQPASQQPYYQQYLNASNPNLSAGAPGRPPAGSAAPSGSSQSPSSDFKHSGGQVGAKGKGLLLAAGKAGKGLLSKGKSKLRGTGDKNDSSPPQAQPKTRVERRTSWGMSLGSRPSPRADSFGHAHSRSHSGSVSGPAPQTIPEHPAYPTPPTQPPQTSRTSPCDDTLTQGNGNQTSARAPPRPRTPNQLAGPHGDGDSEPVSPVSDTHSISASNSYARGNDGEFHVGGDLQIPRPIGKTQPSWDPFTGTPLFEEDGFEIGLSRDPSPHAPPTVYQATYAPQAAKTRTATSVPRNNALDDQHDDWVVVSPQSPPSGQVQVVSPQSPPQPLRSFQPTDSSREILEDEDGETPAISHPIQLHPQQSQQPQQQTIQHLPSQQQAASPQRNSSFVGLPPIRRSSTFGINLTKRAKKRFSLDEDEDDHSVPSPVGTTTDQYGGRGGTASSRLQQEEPGWSAQPTRIDTAPSSSRKDTGMSHNVFSATSTQAATLATDSTGVTGADWRIDDEKRPLAPGAAFKGAGHVPGPIDTGAAMQSDGRTNGPPYGPGMRPQQGMMSPTFGGGGNPIHHLPPQGPWKLEESHLSEPLAASRNRQSGGSLSPQQQSFFGYEKEMGVPPPAAPRPETQLPPRQKFSEVPPSSAQRYPGLFSPPQREQNPGSPTGPRTSRDLGQQYYGRDSTSLYRTRTGDSDVSTFDPSVDEERGRSRRSSGFFKEIGGRLSRESSHRRPASKAAEAAPGDPVGPVSPDVRGDEVSEASIATREFQDRQRRRSSFFLNLRGSRLSDTGVPQSGDREGITQSPKPSPNPGVSPPVQQPASFADRKRLFLGPPGNELSPALPNSSLSRSSTSTVGNDAAGGVVGPPKKRFSGFTSKVFSRTSSQQDLQIPQKPGTSHSATSSMLGRPPGTPVNQPGVPSPLAPQGRERSNTTGSGPYNVQQAQVNKQLQHVEEEDRGRRSSAGGFLSGLFSKRAAPKHQENQQSVHRAQNENVQVPSQFIVQHPIHQAPPSSLGSVHRGGGQPPSRSLLQQFGQQQHQEHQHHQQTHFPSQDSDDHPAAGTEFHTQPPVTSLRQKKSNGSFLPPPQPSQQCRALAEQGAQPWLGVESDDRAASFPSRTETQDPSVLRQKSGQLLDRVSQPVPAPSAPVPQAQREQDSPEPRHGNEQREILSSAQLPQGQLLQSNDQNQDHWVPQGFSAEPTPEPSISHGMEREQAPGSHAPSLAQSHSGNAHALGTHGSGHVERILDQSASILSPSGARAKSPSGGPASQSGISQHSSTSTSPQPTVASQMQPPVKAPVLGPQTLLPGSSLVSPPTGTSGNVHQFGPTGQPLPNPVPLGQQQFPVARDRLPSQASQTSSSPNQRSTMPLSGQPQPQPPQGPHSQGQESSVSKWFKNRTSTQPAPSQSHHGHAKESAAKSIFSAFKRSSKQPEPRQPQQQQQQMPHPGQAQRSAALQGQQRTPPPGPLTQRDFHPSHGHHPMYQQQRQSPSPMGPLGQRSIPQHDVSRGSSGGVQNHGHMPQHRGTAVDSMITREIPTSEHEPRYDQVPIPQGYAAVHGEGGVAPSPYAISRASPPGKFPPYQVPPVQHWSPPSAAQRHPSEVSLYNQPGSTVAHGQHSLQGHRHPNAMSEGGRRISMASHQSNMSHTSHTTQPGIGGPNGSPSVFGQQHQQQDPTGLRIVNDDGGRQGAASTLQVGQEDPPSSHQAHQQRSSSVKAAAPYVASLQVHQTRDGDAVGQISSNNGGQPISQTAVSLQSEAQTQTRGLAAGSGSVTGGNSRSVSPGTQVAGGSNISPEPQARATSRLSVNVQKANQETPDDIYDSTPRLSSGPPPPPAKPIVSTATGQSMVSDSSADEAPRNATHVNGNANANGAASAALASGKSTRAELEDTEDERKRTIRHEAQEEKILVDPYEELQSGGIKYRKEEDPEVPQMSATSYPGQEWNPYGAGGYEDWD